MSLTKNGGTEILVVTGDSRVSAVTPAFAIVAFISPVKVICCIALESASNVFCLLRLTVIILYFFSK